MPTEYPVSYYKEQFRKKSEQLNHLRKLWSAERKELLRQERELMVQNQKLQKLVDATMRLKFSPQQSKQQLRVVQYLAARSKRAA